MLISNVWSFEFYLLAVTVAAFPFGKKKKNPQRQSNCETVRVYDYIVIGAGSSGALLASRLAKETKYCVLLLEAGKTPSSQTNIPAYAGELQHTDMNWGYLWEPQPNFALGLDDYRLPCPRGKSLGGTSAINYMIHARGNKGDFDSWGGNGNAGWSFEDLLPYFKKYENYTVKKRDLSIHGVKGTLSVTDVPYRSIASCAFVDAMREYGYKYVDYNGRHQIGVSFVHSTIKGGFRDSAYRAFLKPVLNGTANLTVITEALVTKILIHPSKGAYGVAYVRDGKKYCACNQKEIILSAGAINSPQLLMLSGIGPRRHLKELGIHVIKDLPVGTRLRDHIGFVGLTYTVNESITFTTEQFLSKESLAILKRSGVGPLTTSAGVEALAMVDTDCWSRGHNTTKPNVEYAFFGTSLNMDKGSSMKRIYRISDYIYEKFWKKIEGRPAFTITPILYKSKSMGCVKLRCSDPFEYPLLYGGFYTDPKDIKVMINAIRLIQKVIQMPALRRYNATLLTPVPGCEIHMVDTDQYWECALRHLPMTFYDPYGTCKMGAENDAEAIVDPELKVKGVKNLRVVDASVFPYAVSGHLNGVCYAIAEKIADLIIHGDLKQELVPSTTTKKSPIHGDCRNETIVKKKKKKKNSRKCRLKKRVHKNKKKYLRAIVEEINKY